MNDNKEFADVQSEKGAREVKIAVIGAGVAGLIAAKELVSGERLGGNVHVDLIEQGERVGGRVQTEEYLTDQGETFLLDHGFQVLLTAYPEVRRHLRELLPEVRCFAQGAVLAYDGRPAARVLASAPSTKPDEKELWVVANPLTYPRGIFGTLRTVVYRWGLLQTLADVCRLACRLIFPQWVFRGAYTEHTIGEVSTNCIRGLSKSTKVASTVAHHQHTIVTAKPPDTQLEPATRPDGLHLTTDLYLSQHVSLSPAFVNGFLRPFFEAIYVSPLSCQRAALFNFVLRMLAVGGAALPPRGIRGVPEHLLEQIQDRTRHSKNLSLSCVFGTQVSAIEQVAGGSRLSVRCKPSQGNSTRTTRELVYDFVILATDWAAAHRLLEPYLCSKKAANEHDAAGCLEDEDKPLYTESATYYFSLPAEELPVTEPLIVLHSYDVDEAAVLAANNDRGPAPLEEPLLGGGAASASTERAVAGNKPKDFYPFRVSNVGFPSVVQSSYAPQRKHLLAATVMRTDYGAIGAAAAPTGTRGNDDKAATAWPGEGWVLQEVVSMLRLDHHGRGTKRSPNKENMSLLTSWKFLKRFVIPFHQPHHGCGMSRVVFGHQGRIIACGDYTCDPTLDGAMRSGSRAAELVAQSVLSL
ncbi:unnamed protein product [Amoebophrya sp. A120]|nr:unnamed protein product [Amoebophrya sp. A120]|eukprot:GSA120T00002626001.1